MSSYTNHTYRPVARHICLGGSPRVSLRTADVFPVVPPKNIIFGGTTGNTSAVRRLPRVYSRRKVPITGQNVGVFFRHIRTNLA